MNAPRKRFILVSFFLALALFAGYVVFQARVYLRGPLVRIESAERRGQLLVLSGTAKRIAFLLLNGKQIYTDERGRWQERVLLNWGYTIVTAAARDRFGRETETHHNFYLPAENK